MSAERFSYRDQVELDLGRGHLRLSGSDPSRIAVPAEALAELMDAAGEESAQQFGRVVGEAAGARVRARLGDQAETASIEAVVDHLAGELAVHGFGALGLERWGRILVLTIQEPAWDQRGDIALGAVLSACLVSVFAEETLVAVSLPRSERQARFIVLNQSTAMKVRSWLKVGASWGAIVERLHQAQE